MKMTEKSKLNISNSTYVRGSSTRIRTFLIINSWSVLINNLFLAFKRFWKTKSDLFLKTFTP
jgi:hypothetical protein